MVEYLNPQGLHEPVDNTYSHVSLSRNGTIVRIGGQVAVGVDGENLAIGDMAAQIAICYEQVTMALTAVHLTWRDVVHVYTFTTDIDEYIRREQEEVRRYFGSTPPPSTVVQVQRLVDRNWLLEVQVDAIGGDGPSSIDGV